MREHAFTFQLGLVVLADPVRPTVPAAVQECYTAGIRVVMIAGGNEAAAARLLRGRGLLTLAAIHAGLHQPV